MNTINRQQFKVLSVVECYSCQGHAQLVNAAFAHADGEVTECIVCCNCLNEMDEVADIAD